MKNISKIRIICFLLVVVMVFTSNVFSSVYAEEVTSGKCGFSNVYWRYADGVITFTGTGTATGYNTGGQPYKHYITDITKAVFSEGIEGIGSGALNGAKNLAEVVIADSVTKINGSAFYGCKALASIEIPGNLTLIGDNAFNASGLKNITVNSESRFSIGNNAFAFCGGLSSFEIPYGAVSIGEYAFNNCQSLRKVVIPDTVEVISSYAFRNCIQLKYAQIPDSVTSIEDTAFVNSANANLDTVILTPYLSYAYEYAKERGIKYAFSDENDINEWLFADFEATDISGLNISGMTATRIHTEAPDKSLGALEVNNSNSSGYLYSDLDFMPGTTYRLSAWIKAQGIANGYCSFDVKDETGERTLVVNKELLQNEWTYIETEFCAQKEEWVALNVPCNSYLIDNLAVIPLCKEIECSYTDNIASGGTIDFTVSAQTAPSGYYYEIQRDDGIILADGTTAGNTVNYAPDSADVGHKIKFICAFIEDSERLSKFIECETGVISEASDTECDYPDEKLSNRYVLENYNLAEELDSYKSFGSPTVSYTETIREGKATGAAQVTVNSKYDSLKYNFQPVKGEAYEISLWVKHDYAEAISNPAIFMETAGTEDGYYLYEILTDSKTVVESGEWTKLSFSYYHDGKAVLTGTGGQYYDTINSVDVSIRLGEGSGFSYLIDDIRIVPENISALVKIEGKSTVSDKLIVNALSKFNTDGYIYTVRCGENVLMNGFSKEGKIEVPVKEEYLGKNIIAEVSAVDGGKISNACSATSTTVSYREDVAESNFSTKYIGGNELMGSIEYESQQDTYNPWRVLALYNKEGMLSDVRSLDNGEFDIELDNGTDFDSARLFLFDKDTMKPLNDFAEITRNNTDYIIYIDAKLGDDTNDGTFESPLKTIVEAKKRVREILPYAENDIYVMLKSGEYKLDETLVFDNNDCGDNVDVIYTTYGHSQAYISGGKRVDSEWEIYDKEKNIYRSYVGTDVRTRQLYVNDMRAIRARSEIKLVGIENGTYDEIGHTTTDTSFLDYKYPKDLEMVYFKAWSNPRCLVDSIYMEDGLVRIKMNEIGWTNLRNKNNAATLAPKAPAYCENAYELLDEEREWYLNIHDGYLYYKPAEFEDMDTAEFVMPVLEKLIEISGNENDFAGNITFDNIGFKYATWLRPSTDIGHSDAQNNKIRDGVKVTYNNDGTYNMEIAIQTEYYPDAAVEVYYAENVNFIDCTFAKLGSIGLKMADGVKEFKLKGNKVYDISGNGICIGEPYRYNEKDTEDKYVMRDIEITDNIIFDTGEEFKSSGALSVTFAKNCLIKNNEIFNSSYSGIHIGHCPDTYTQNLRIENNYVHDCLNEELSDGGGIYHSNGTSGTEENPNVVSGNYVRDIMNNAWRIAFDNNSSGYWVYDNVVDATRARVMNEIAYDWAGDWEIKDIDGYNWDVIIDNNYGTHGIPESERVLSHHKSEFAEWNDAARAIIENAGFTAEYKNRFDNIVRKAEISDAYEAYEGKIINIDMLLYGYKDAIFTGDNCKIVITGADEEILQVNPDMSIWCMNKGTDELNVYLITNEVIKTNKITVTVK